MICIFGFMFLLFHSAIVALYDEEKDNEVDWKGVRAEALGPIVH